NAGRADRPEPQPVGVGGVDPRQNLDEDDEDDDGDGDGTTATRDRDRPTGTAGGTDGHRGNSWTARAGMLVSTTLRKCPASPAGRWLPPARRLVQRIQRTVERGHLEQPDAVRGTLHGLRTVGTGDQELGHAVLMGRVDLVGDAADGADRPVDLDGAGP